MKRIGIRMIVKQDKSKVGDNTKIRTKHHAFEIWMDWSEEKISLQEKTLWVRILYTACKEIE